MGFHKLVTNYREKNKEGIDKNSILLTIKLIIYYWG